MNREHMLRMSPAELDAYARTMGFSVRGAKTAEQKAALIEERRAHEAEISVLGVTVTVPVKRMHDKRVTDLLSKEGRADEETERMMRMVVGDESWDEIVRAATEEDGTVDNDAIAHAIVSVVTSRELKNY